MKSPKNGFVEGRREMRAFLLAAAAIVVISIAANVVLGTMDFSSETVFQTTDVRTGQ